MILANAFFSEVENNTVNVNGTLPWGSTHAQRGNQRHSQDQDRIAEERHCEWKSLQKSTFWLTC